MRTSENYGFLALQMAQHHLLHGLLWHCGSPCTQCTHGTFPKRLAPVLHIPSPQRTWLSQFILCITPSMLCTWSRDYACLLVITRKAEPTSKTKIWMGFVVSPCHSIMCPQIFVPPWPQNRGLFLLLLVQVHCTSLQQFVIPWTLLNDCLAFWTLGSDNTFRQLTCRENLI